jgi:hypothetical protein
LTKRKKAKPGRRRHRRQVRDWGSLNDFAIKALLRSRVPHTTLMRAMGLNVPAVLLNPPNGRNSMARRRRRNPQEQLGLGEYAGRKPASRAAADALALGPFHGPYGRESHVKMGRRARGRGKATVYGPVRSASAYKARKRPKKRAAARRRRKGGRGPQTLAAARRMPKALRAYWVKRLGGGRGRRPHKKGARGRMPSKKALRRFVGRLPGKAKLVVYPGYRRGERLPKGRRVKTRTYANPRSHSMKATYTNPRRRRRRHNPGFAGGAVQTLTHSAIPGSSAAPWPLGSTPP